MFFLLSTLNPYVVYLRGYKRFYRRTSLETSDYLKDDCLIMNCTVGVVRNHIETPTQLSIFVPPPDLGQCLKELFTSGIGSDIDFEVGDETFKAHKQILAARSPVFSAQFFGLIGNPNVDKIVVEDVEPPIFKVVVMQFLIICYILQLYALLLDNVQYANIYNLFVEKKHKKVLLPHLVSSLVYLC